MQTDSDIFGFDNAALERTPELRPSTEQALQLALTDPDHPMAMSQRDAKRITGNRIRSAMAELSHGKIEKVSAWLDAVAADDPAKAIELFIELAQFNMPKLKAIAVDVRSSDGSVKSLSVTQLEQMLAENKVVSEQ